MARKAAPSQSQGRPPASHSPVKRAATDELDEEEARDIKPFKRARGRGRGSGLDAGGDGVASGSGTGAEADGVPATQYEDDEDDEMDVDGEGEGGERDSKAHIVKQEGGGGGVRAKRETKGEEEDEASEYDEEDDGEGGKTRKKRRKARAQAYERDRDGYVKGSILRVRLENFVTYDYVDFRPGPHLNMIIGPNGTGKSTIVCGIVLGLGGTPRLLGRQPEISKFVKQGREAGWTEVTLKDGIGKRPIVIRREINRTDKRSVWKINGEVSTMQAVINHTNRLDIQVGNLCSFLPQDKVAEFAQMAPTTLLSETIKAAGHSGLTGWHEQLVEDGRNFRRIDGDLEKEQERLERMKAQQADLEPQVNQLNERREMRRDIVFLQNMVPVAQTRELKEAVKRTKLEAKAANQALEAEKNRHEPLAKLRKKVASKVKAAQHAGVEADKAVASNISKARAIMREYADEETRFERATEKLRSIKDQEKTRKDRMSRLKDKIETYRKATEVDAAEIDEASFRRDIAKTNEKLREAKQLESAAQQVVDDMQAQSSRVQEMQAEKRKQLKVLQDIKQKREANLATIDPSCGYAMQWYHNNRDKFDQEVFFPPAVSLEVKDRACAPIVEACIPFDVMKTFVCQTQKDYATLNSLNDDPRTHKVMSNGRLKPVRINTTHVNVEDFALLDQRGQHDEQQLRALGLDGYVLDLCDAPKPVLAFVNQRTRLQLTAYRLDGHHNQNPTPLNDRQVENSGIRQFIVWDARKQTGSRTNTIVSAYGNRGKQSNTQQVMRARLLAETIDQVRVEALNSDLAELAARHRSFEGQISKASQEAKKQADLTMVAREKAGKAKTALQVATQQLRRYVEAKGKLEVAQQELAELEAAPTAQERRQAIMQELTQIARDRASILKRHHKQCKKGTDFTEQSVIMSLSFLQSKANETAVEQQYNQRDQRAEHLKSVFDQLSDKWVQLRDDLVAQIAAYRKRYNDLLATMTDTDERDAFNERVQEAQVQDQRTAAEFEQALEDTRQSLRLLPNLDEGLIERLRVLTEDIVVKERAVHASQRDHARLKGRIDATLAKFKEHLYSLVETISAKFGAAFERIGCQGQVQVREHPDDYAQWAIEILVKFRDEEQLQVLTAQRQSGGERSMTTIMYLMSLTELARTPFSLVDEINQGMDQRAERAVHDQLVETTCHANAGQYFLITPKLLTGLKYHKMMKVLCINNGAWLPDRDATPHVGDLAAVLKARKRRLAAAEA